MSSFLRTVMATSRRLASPPALRAAALQSRANLHARPAKSPIGPAEQVVAVSAFAAAILVPMWWILSHLEDYKKKE